MESNDMTDADIAAPLVTVGIPFYNNQETMLDSIKSIFAQTFQDWELLLVDDGSTDNSLQIAQSIDDPRVRVFSDGCNKKLPARLNQIIEMARGKYIARMDADDLCSPDRLEKQLELFKQNPTIDVVGTGIVYLGPDDKPLGISRATITHEKICEKPYRTFGICHASILAKKSWYVQNHHDESALLVEDFKLWLESYEKSHFGNVPDPLYYYRCEMSFSQKKLFIARLNSIKILFRHYLRKKSLFEAIYYSLLQVLKMSIGPIICLLKSKRNLIQRRYKNIDDMIKQEHEQILKQIKNIELPIKYSD